MAMECDVLTTTPERPEQSPEKRRTGFRRQKLSLERQRFAQNSSNVTPSLSKIRSCLFRSPNARSSTAQLGFDETPRDQSKASSISPISSPVPSFKWQEPMIEESPRLVKRNKKSISLYTISETVDSPKEHSIPKRRFSESDVHAQIETAIQRSTTDSCLTGDFSKLCILPLASGDHDDHKSISSETLASLIRGEFSDCVSDFKIVDCRYPYEFDGGHIDGAINLYDKDLIEQNLMEPLSHTPEIEPESKKRSILVFHCEFSQDRGPTLSRFLRSLDRQRNMEHYPALHYPEIYLLHGGYEQFYKQHLDLCSPMGYKPMRDPNHEDDLKKFRSKSKSCQGGKARRKGLSSRTNLKRLVFS